ncbi:unnamed protein product [Psylliodes chrysocephalus]|uniref:Uncharacterized protein n=1 Tax=Psylliodes chrysocephalus TaxID=3402493 RepID=A0A9P0CYW0_9CUCU|nr:unnamed protein product [Psylliodes chrysocephala]
MNNWEKCLLQLALEKDQSDTDDDDEYKEDPFYCSSNDDPVYIPQDSSDDFETYTESDNDYVAAFYFTINDNRIRVCKAFFKATLDITDQPIRTALIKETESGFLDGDKRGRHGNQPKVDPEIKDSVRNFINAILRIESHYLRAQTAHEQGKANLVDAYNLHQKDKELSRKEKEANKINVNGSHVAIYDLQILPFLEVKYRHFTTKANLTATTSPS